MAVTVLALLVAACEQPGKAEPPVIKFTGTSENGALTFEVTNPNAVDLHYDGWPSDSFSPGLKEGTIAPLYCIELLTDNEWKEEQLGWCGTGMGLVTLSPKGKVTFEAAPPRGKWDNFHVGFTWYKTPNRKERAVAWSDALGKDDLARKQ